MTDPDNFFGPDRDDPPGLRPDPRGVPPQLTDFMVESGAVHSRSRGWLPVVVIRMRTEDGAGLTCSLVVGEKLTEIAENLLAAGVRAREDVEAGIRDGVIREGGETR